MGLLVGYLLCVLAHLLVEIVTHSVFIMLLSLESGRMSLRRKLNRDASISYDQTRFRSKAAEDRFNASYAN
ncbi:hypothetical protein U1Q18_005518 [Sarracenia purpurea var. burkii]